MESEDKSQELESKEEKPTVDVDSLMKRVEQLESSNSRLLDESKTWKEKYQGVKTQKQKEEEAKLTENEQWKELLEIEKNKVHELSSKVKNLTTTTMQRDLQYKVASLARDAYNVDDVVTAISKTGALDIDKDSGSISGVEEAYNRVREEKPYLFNTAKKSGMGSNRPDDMIPKEKSLDEQIEENPNDILASVLKDLI